MKFYALICLAILSSCSALPFFVEDVKEVIECEEKKEVDHKVHLNKNTVLVLASRWYWEETCDNEEYEKIYRERARNFEEYYQYHFGDYINKQEYALRVKKNKWPIGFCKCYDEFDDWLYV